MKEEGIDRNCLCDFDRPWLLTRELHVNGSSLKATTTIKINAFKMATTSQSFRAMLQAVGRDGKLCLNCDRPRDLEVVLRYAHLGKINIDQSNVEKLIDIAQNFDVPSLSEHCENFLINSITIENCWIFWKLAKKYSNKTNRWEHVAPLLSKRNRSSASILNEKIYVCGGNSGDYGAVINQWLCSCETYDPFTNQWTFIKPIPESIWGCYKLITVNERLYLIQSCRVSVYDLLKKTWKVLGINNMPEHYSFTVTEMDGEIYRFNDSSVDKWRPEDLSWNTVKESVFTPGWGHQSISVKGVNIVNNILSKSTQVMN